MMDAICGWSDDVGKILFRSHAKVDPPGLTMLMRSGITYW